MVQLPRDIPGPGREFRADAGEHQLIWMELLASRLVPSKREGEGNFKALFESMERDQIRRGVLGAKE